MCGKRDPVTRESIHKKRFEDKNGCLISECSGWITVGEYEDAKSYKMTREQMRELGIWLIEQSAQ